MILDSTNSKKFAFVANGVVAFTRDIPNDQPIPEGFVQYRPSDPPVAPEGSIAVRTGHVVDKEGYCTDAWVITPLFDAKAVEQPAPVPTEVPLWAFRDVLIRSGLMPAINAAITSLPEPQQSIIRNQFENRDPVVRQDPDLDMMAKAIGKTPTDIDNVFIQANALK